MKVDEFLEYRHGITLSDEKMLIDPTFFVKVMNEYAHHKIEEAQALKAINYSFTGRDYNDALAIAEATSLDFPKPWPTTPFPSPTTTIAENPKARPPLVTLVTR